MGINCQDLVFVDESGSSIAMTRRYARAPRGERAVGSVPRNHGTPTSILAALSVEGLGEVMTLPGAVDASAFRVYVEGLLCPSLRPGQVVVMDNLSVHKGEPIREMIEAVGCSLLFLPPYSPDFSPIELTFSKMKAGLRAIGARTQDQLDEAITQVIGTVQESDAIGWFAHCGYSLPSPN